MNNTLVADPLEERHRADTFPVHIYHKAYELQKSREEDSESLRDRSR